MSLLIILGYGASYSMGLPKQLPTNMGPIYHKSPLLPKDGFPYLPYSFMLWKSAMMAKRGMNTIKLPTETAELGAIINTKQRNQLIPGDLRPGKPGV